MLGLCLGSSSRVRVRVRVRARVRFRVWDRVRVRVWDRVRVRVRTDLRGGGHVLEAHHGSAALGVQLDTCQGAADPPG